MMLSMFVAAFPREEKSWKIQMTTNNEFEHSTL